MIARVLIVDDSSDNREILRDALEEESYTLSEAADGREAILAVAKEQPDLILLDVMMPNLDGMECCRRLKADAAAQHIPIIMVTALNESQDVVRALDAGASDYVSKPICSPIVRARVRAALRSKFARDAVAARNREILQLSYAMTHDLQTPLASLTGAVESLNTRLIPQSDEKVARWLDRIRKNATHMASMLDDLMVYAKAGTEKLENEFVDLSHVVLAALENVQAVAERNDVQVSTDLAPLAVMGDSKALVRVATNLIANAVKYINSERGGVVRITVATHGAGAQLIVEDNGPGIPVSQLERVLLPFARATAEKTGTGLGLAIVKKYVDALGGRVWLESDGEHGTRAIVELPAARTQGRNIREGRAA